MLEFKIRKQCLVTMDIDTINSNLTCWHAVGIKEHAVTYTGNWKLCEDCKLEIEISFYACIGRYVKTPWWKIRLDDRPYTTREILTVWVSEDDISEEYIETAFKCSK